VRDLDGGVGFFLGFVALFFLIMVGLHLLFGWLWLFWYWAIGGVLLFGVGELLFDEMALLDDGRFDWKWRLLDGEELLMVWEVFRGWDIGVLVGVVV
jgi:hypothetical protein